MEMANPRMIYAIAKKEFMDNIRNRWVIILSILLFLLILIFSYVAAGQAGGDDVVGDMRLTVTGLLGISPLLIPLIAVILGFNTIAGEAESGSLMVVLSYPVRRIEVLVGKVLGLGSVIAFSTIIGFGSGGIIILGANGGEYWLEYLAFIGLTILLGFIFLSLTIFVSSFAKKRIHAIGGAILIFFWGMIIGTVLFAVLLGSGYSFSDIGALPDWAFYSAFLSPADLHQTTVQVEFGYTYFEISEFIRIDLPGLLQNMAILMTAHVIWFFVPFGLAYYFFRRRDI